MKIHKYGRTIAKLKKIVSLFLAVLLLAGNNIIISYAEEKKPFSAVSESGKFVEEEIYISLLKKLMDGKVADYIIDDRYSIEENIINTIEWPTKYGSTRKGKFYMHMPINLMISEDEIYMFTAGPYSELVDSGAVEAMKVFSEACIYLTDRNVTSQKDAEKRFAEMLVASENGFKPNTEKQYDNIIYRYSFSENGTNQSGEKTYWFGFRAKLVE